MQLYYNRIVLHDSAYGELLETFTPSPSSWRLKNVDQTQLGKMIVKQNRERTLGEYIS
jgi:acyl-CoA reductase-like NAD-dependent aldehyde dehydrogenase